MENNQDALKSLQKAISLNEKFALAYKTKAKLQIIMKKDSDAVQSFQSAITQDPSNCKLYYLLANQFRQMKKYKDALDAINKSIELNSNFTVAQSCKAMLL